MRISKEFIFREDLPFASCHASTLTTDGDGRFIAAWFAGSHEGAPDVAIWFSRRDAGGWSPPDHIAGHPGLPHWNPVLCRSPSGRLHLFYKVGPNCREWRTRCMRREESPGRWLPSRELSTIEGFPLGPVRSKPIVTADGAWVAPTSRERSEAWDAAVAVSRDDGESWRLGGIVPLDHAHHAGLGVIQPTLWEPEAGRLSMLLRSTSGRIERSDSEDGGAHWCRAYPTELPSNNSGIDIARGRDGTLALCYNPVALNWGKRTPLVVALSSDDGNSWHEAATIEDEDLTAATETEVHLDRAHRPNEFSYPSLIPLEDGYALSYTWKRERIAFCRLRR